jgi:hypothetical protein
MLDIHGPQLISARFAYLSAYQWAAIVPKEAMHFKSGEDNLHFYSTNLKEMKYVLPCKVSTFPIKSDPLRTRHSDITVL